MLEFFYKHKGTRGTISIMLVLLLLPLYSTAALLLEGGRARAAQQQLDELTTMGCMAILADYYDYLQTNYGLLAFDSTTISEKSFSEFITNRTTTGGINTLSLNKYFDVSVEDCEVGYMYSLADPSILAEQIEQYGKFSMPTVYLANLTLKGLLEGLMNKLKKYTKALDQISNAVQLFRNVQKFKDSAAGLRVAIDNLELAKQQYDTNYAEYAQEFKDNCNTLKELLKNESVKASFLGTNSDDSYSKVKNAITKYNSDDDIKTHIATFISDLASWKSDLVSGYLEKSNKKTLDNEKWKELSIDGIDDKSREYTYSEAISMINERANKIFCLNKKLGHDVDIKNEKDYDQVETLLNELDSYLSNVKSAAEAQEAYDTAKTAYDNIKTEGQNLSSKYADYVKAFDSFNKKLQDTMTAMKATAKAIDDATSVDEKDISYYNDNDKIIKVEKETKKNSEGEDETTYKIVGGESTLEAYNERIYSSSDKSKANNLAANIMKTDFARYHTVYSTYMNNMISYYYSGSSNSNAKELGLCFAYSETSKNIDTLSSLDLNMDKYKISVEPAKTPFDMAYDSRVSNAKSKIIAAFQNNVESEKNLIEMLSLGYAPASLPSTIAVATLDSLSDKLETLYNESNVGEFDELAVYGGDNCAKYLPKSTLFMISMFFTVSNSLEAMAQNSNIFKALSDIGKLAMSLSPADLTCNSYIMIDDTYPSEQYRANDTTSEYVRTDVSPGTTNMVKNKYGDVIPNEEKRKSITDSVSSKIKEYNSLITDPTLTNTTSYYAAPTNGVGESLFEKGARLIKQAKEELTDGVNKTLFNCIKISSDGSVSLKFPNIFDLIDGIKKIIDGIVDLVKGVGYVIAAIVDFIKEFIADVAGYLLKNAYVGYYGITMFTNRLDNNVITSALAAGNNYRFISCEQEYIVVGSGSELANQVTAYYMIFAMRFVINLVSCSSNEKLQPLYAIPVVGQVLYFVVPTVETFIDMVFMLNGNDVVLIKDDPYIIDWDQFSEEIKELAKSYKDGSAYADSTYMPGGTVSGSGVSGGTEGKPGTNKSLSSAIDDRKKKFLKSHSEKFSGKYDKNGHEIMKSKLQLSYKDYLFVIMLMYPNDIKTARIGDLIQMHLREQKNSTTVKLSDYKTYMYVDIKTKYSPLLPLIAVDGIEMTKLGERSTQYNGY